MFILYYEMGFYILFFIFKLIKLVGDLRVVSEVLWMGFYYWSKLYKICLFYKILLKFIKLI